MYDRVDWYPSSHAPVKMDDGQWCIWYIGYILRRCPLADFELVEMMYEEQDGTDVLIGSFREIAAFQPAVQRLRLAGLPRPPHPPPDPAVFHVGLNVGDDDMLRA